MLGSMLLDYLSRQSDLELVATVRTQSWFDTLARKYPKVKMVAFDAETCDQDDLQRLLENSQWAINAIGVIKPYIHDNNRQEVCRAICLNAGFPCTLAEVAAKVGCQVIEPTTDCVFSGNKGEYVETDFHDAIDVYGRTKSLGEVRAAHVHNLRCSLIGPELKGHLSLMAWFLGQPTNAQVDGYANHYWNGITTLQFAKVCYGIMTWQSSLPVTQHVIPDGIVTKAELLDCLRNYFSRQDIAIKPVEARHTNRTLKTTNPSLNYSLWYQAGYYNLPSIPQMVGELAEWMNR